MADNNDFQKYSKEQFMQDFTFDLDDLASIEEESSELVYDDGDSDLGGTSSAPDIPKPSEGKIIVPSLNILNPPKPKKTSLLYEELEKERGAFPFRPKQKRLSVQLDSYDTSICSTVNNQFAFMPVEQNISLSYFLQQMKEIKKNPEIQPAMYNNIEALLTEYLGLIDSRFSLFKTTLLIQKTENKYFAENLYALDLKYLGLGYSREKYSVMSPFLLMELFDDKNIKKHHLAELFDDLEFLLLHPLSNLDVQL